MSQADLCLVDSVANAPPPFPGITTTAAVHDSSSPAPTQMDHGKPANETSPINQPLVCFPSFLQNFDHFFLLQTTISMGTLKVCFAHSSLECDVVSNISWLEFCYQYLEFFAGRTGSSSCLLLPWGGCANGLLVMVESSWLHNLPLEWRNSSPPFKFK